MAGGLLAAAVAEAVLDEGGFRPGSRIIFGALAGAATVAAWRSDRAATQRAARAPVALVLWALAVLGALSALWTVGAVGSSVRWALVTFGYGCVFVSAAVLARRRRAVAAIATGIATLASTSALFGIAAAASHTSLFADYVRGTWRPGGTLEYSAAMSLLAVSALPAVLAAMCARSRRLVAAGSLSGTTCAIVLALDDSRIELSLAAFVCLVAFSIPERTVRAGRLRAIGAVGTLLAVAVTAHLIAGGRVPSSAPPHTLRTLTELGLVGVIAGAAWMGASWLSRARFLTGARMRRRVVLGAAALVLVGAVVLGIAAARGASSAATGHPSVARHGPTGGFWHGRGHLWRVSIDEFGHRPLVGSGADSFLAATAARQGPSPIRFAHDLPLELAVELGIPGLLLALGLYAGTAIVIWRARSAGAAWLLIPAAGAFMAANLLDWSWHLAGSGAVWAAALGGLAAWARVGPAGTRVGAAGSPAGSAAAAGSA